MKHLTEFSGDMLGLRDKRVAVVGAASGIGAATAELLRELGADVVGLDVREPTDAEFPWVSIDLRDESSIRHAATELARVDCLHCCAGLPQTADGLDVMLVGFVGPRLLIELVAREMSAGSAIVCVASTAASAWASDARSYAELLALHDFDAAAAWCSAHVSEPGHNYRLTKSAVIAYTAASAGRLAGRGPPSSFVNGSTVFVDGGYIAGKAAETLGDESA